MPTVLLAACATHALRAQRADAGSRTAAPGPAPVAVLTLGTYPIGTDALTVRATVRGRTGTAEGVFLWDTGEGVTMLTPAFAKAIGCTPWGQVTGYRMTGERIDAPHCDDLTVRVPGAALPAPSAIVFDLMSFYQPDAPRLDGALGLDVFAGQAITFQLARRTITIESPASLAARVARATEVPARVVRGAEGLALDVNLGVSTPAGMAWMELDSGNSGPSMFIARYLAAQFQLDTLRKAPQPVRLSLGGRVPVETVARTLPRMAIDGNLGVTFLRAWDVTLDLATGRAWVAAASRP